MLLCLGASLKRVNGAIIVENVPVPPCSILQAAMLGVASGRGSRLKMIIILIHNTSLCPGEYRFLLFENKTEKKAFQDASQAKHFSW